MKGIGERYKIKLTEETLLIKLTFTEQIHNSVQKMQGGKLWWKT